MTKICLMFIKDNSNKQIKKQEIVKKKKKKKFNSNQKKLKILNIIKNIIFHKNLLKFKKKIFFLLN
jgi:hypothetical protein